MWTYEKKLQFPVNIRKPDPAFAKIVISQIGGPDGELAASMRYLNQRYAMPYDSVRAMLTDIGTACSFGNGIRNPVSADQKSQCRGNKSRWI